MDNLPKIITLPFSDGVRDVPEHVAVLLKAHRIATHEMTYAQAIERLNWANADHFLNEQINRITSAHLREFGR